MKEIQELKTLSLDPIAFRRAYEFNDLKVQKDYGDEYFDELITELSWRQETKSILKLWMCISYFDEYVEKLINRIKDRIDNDMSSPSAPTYKTEYLKSIFKEIFQLYNDFSSLGSQFGRLKHNDSQALFKSIFTQLTNFKQTDEFSGQMMVKDMFNYTQQLLKMDNKGFFDQLKGCSVSNLLAIACDGVAINMLYLNKFILNVYSKYLDKKEVERLLKKIFQGAEVVPISKRGRPQKTESNQTLIDIWNNEKRSFESVVQMLLEPRSILDYKKGFIVKEDSRLIWQKEPAGCHVKYIQGFLLFCHKEGFINLEKYSSRTLQGIFERTFTLSVNNKSMFSKNILAVEEMYYRHFW
jgi:hypothetical protein